MGLRRSLQLCCKSLEQSFTMCGSANSSKMFKQTPFLLSREHTRGLWRGQTLGGKKKKKRKAKAGWELSCCVACSLMLNTKTAPCQGAAKAGLLQRQNELGNEGNPCAAPHRLNGAGLDVVIGSIDHPRQGEVNWKVQDPPRKPNQDRGRR